MRLVAATRNRGKVREISEALSGLGVELIPFDELPDPPQIEEEGETYEENAAHKALTVARHTGLPAVADDSGLEVEALGGAPGVRSARFAGEKASDEERIAKLLKLLEGLPLKRRRARFVCVIALATPDGRVELFRGECYGYIAEEPKGKGGFGYDPVFLVPEYGKTFAELGLEVKNRISHRARALRKLRSFLEGRLSDEESR